MTVKELRDKGLIVFEAVMGSRAYGTAMPTSDTDIRGVYVQPMDDILGFGYVEQVSDEKNDVIFYEIKRFLELVEKNNPNILELLNAPESCVLHKDPLFDVVLEFRDKFVTKKCKHTFAGYAVNQIRKAKGYNKKINWEESEMKRKTVLDFCYVLYDSGSVPVLEYFERKRKETGIAYKQEHFGLAKIDHARDLYAAYYMPFVPEANGIVSDPHKANDVNLSSIPKNIASEGVWGYIYFNKDGYSSHCKKYKEYKEWLENRNEDRFKMNKAHGKNYDSKNMMHTFRLLNMALEIAEGRIVVRRPDDEIETLMKIRRGEYDLDDLLERAEELIVEMDRKFDESDLPERVDRELLNKILIKIRKEAEKWRKIG